MWLITPCVQDTFAEYQTTVNDKKRKLFLIDGSSYIYRAFHALPHLSSPEGLPTNAIYGFTRMLLKVLKDYKPDYLAVVFDSKGPTFRHEAYEEYKATRPEMPETLAPQLPYIREVVRAYNIPALEFEGYEADDIIGTLVKRFKSSGIETVMVTGDKDMMQLVDEGTVILDTMKGRECAADGVVERFGVEPEKVVDIMALAGDSSDNIPGVPGIGEKTASKLIREFGSVDELYRNLDRVSGKAVRERLAANEEKARLSLKLARIVTDVPLECGLEDLSVSAPDYGRLRELFRKLGFTKLSKEIMEDGDCGAEVLEVKVVMVSGAEVLDRLLGEVAGSGEMALSLRTGDGGLAVSTGRGSVYYIAPEDVGGGEYLGRLRVSLEDEVVRKGLHDAKSAYIYFKALGIDLKGVVMDTGVASYLLNPSLNDHSIGTIVREILNSDIGDGEIPAMEALCREAEGVLRVSGLLFSSLEEAGLARLFREVEIPLIRVLAGMEIKGVKVDSGFLHDLSGELEAQLDGLASRIYLLAGTEFNINSPKQLSEILYDRLGLKPGKRTKKGYSTDEETLVSLSRSHELPAEILSYRHLAKLKSTYVDALLDLMDPVTGRVHTSFNQTVTATGRLSSSSPNLQNIPIRTEVGKRIREAFVAEEGCLFLSADYSQIELRLVAHLSGDGILIDAFRNGEDIHARTASEIFGIIPGLVTSEMRRQAKAINFGIIYGMGPYGLARDLGISKNKAREYIENYFARYEGVKAFVERTIEEARTHGYTTTLFGRRRYIPELNSDIEGVRRLGERLAVNTLVQGSAADMIKTAMVKIDKRVGAEGLSSEMILQIHDELIFEVPEEEMETIKILMKEEMEGVMDLAVPIEVNMGVGRNWREAG